MQNDLFEKWYSLSFPNSSLERNEDGSYFRRKTNFSLESFEAGQQSKQAEVDDLKKRIDDALKELEYIHFYKTQNSNNAIKILKGDQS